jgi:hydroxymethylglutaryl-CoA lyase
MSRFPKKVTLVEVSPRDGFQNEKNIIPTATKIDFINQLSKTGLKVIEVTSFVSPKRIPQLADCREVFLGIDKNPNIQYPVLIPNEMGLTHAMDVDVNSIAVLTAASETFSEKNIHCSIGESFQRIEAIFKLKHASNQIRRVRGYISCVLGCPYEGDISPMVVVDMAKRLYDMGCDEISLGDTIGMGTAYDAKKLIEQVATVIPISHIAIHFHDTYGQALANIYACLEMGISIIDSSIAGLGGCPYAPGADGNVATEDVLYMLQGLNIDTGVELAELIEVSRFVTEFTGRPARSKVAQALLN